MKKRRLMLIAAIVLAVVVFFCFTKTADVNAPGEIGNGEDILTEEEYESGEEILEEESEEFYEEETEEDLIYYDSEYTLPEDVAAYLYEWQELPPNFITKKEAEKLGWQSNKGNLWDVAYGMSIGGDYFGNREGILPEGEDYRECDVNYEGGYRDAERLVYSIDDYDIYYTSDHYESFLQLYDAEEGYIGDMEIIWD